MLVSFGVYVPPSTFWVWLCWFPLSAIEAVWEALQSGVQVAGVGRAAYRAGILNIGLIPFPSNRSFGH